MKLLKDQFKDMSFGHKLYAIFIICAGIYLCCDWLGVFKPKCIIEGCYRPRVEDSDYCKKHKEQKEEEEWLNSDDDDDRNTSTYSSTTAASTESRSTSSTSKRYSTTSSTGGDSSYDQGYEDIYDNDDYDEDRYETDGDYADGVDDAMEDVDW